MLLWLVAPALAEAPQQIEVTYNVKFDLPSMADSVCNVTGICDCAMTYRGSGTLQSQSGSRLTFSGTWSRAGGKCHADLVRSIWTPSDGSAFHTISLDGATVGEWVVHSSASDGSRGASGSQFWIAPMAAEIDPETKLASHFERESGSGGALGSIATEHRLSLVLQ
jgi:hypothetical protein